MKNRPDTGAALIKPASRPCQALFVLSVTLISCLLLSGQGLADELHLKNGDRITGQVLKKENGTVSVKTTYAGTIIIKWQDVAHISTAQPVEVYLKNETLVEVSEIDAGPPAGQGGEVAIRTSDIQYINPPPYITGKGILWSGRLNAGYWGKDGNSPQKHFSFDGQLGARTKKQRYTVAGTYLLVEDDGLKTELRSTGSGKIDHFFNSKWYGTAQVQVEKDRFKDINLRTIAGGGLGYQFWESKNLNLAVESGLDYVMVDYLEAVDEEYPAFRWALNFDKFIIKERLQAFHKHQLHIGLEDTEDLLFSSQTGLRILFMTNLNATVEIDYDWDNQPSDDKKRGDTTYMCTVGYSW